MPQKMSEMEKKLDEILPKTYPHKDKKELDEIKWGILRDHGYKPSREKKK